MKRTLDDMTGNVIDPGQRVYRLGLYIADRADGYDKFQGAIELSEASTLEHCSKDVLKALEGECRETTRRQNDSAIPVSG